ncbi:MAG: GIY-YIG nuclease family protein [Roseivirga sp.]
MSDGAWAYITTNRRDGTLYTGVSSELPNRIIKHKDKFYPNSFSARYNCDKLVYYEFHDSIEEAIAREKQIKAGSRQKKIDLIESINPKWNDLYDEIKDWSVS